ncbi:MAG: hypothetical protein PVH88_17675 [Ignavibacteria bacterium]|jgi:hypothetical protein
MKYIIVLSDIKGLETERDATEFRFSFNILDKKYFNKPEHKTKTKSVRVKVGISRTLETMWIRKGEASYNNVNIPKVLYEYAFRHLTQKLEEGTLLEKEEVWLTTTTAPREYPFDSSLIHMDLNSHQEIEIGDKIFMQNQEILKTATKIIELRDTINNIFKERHTGKLFIINNERDLLNLFLDAQSIEDFVYRISALQNSITNLNITLLRTETNISDTQIKSIQLLESYLSQYPNYDDVPIKVFKHINRLRQSYPIHSDTASGVKEAHQYFNLEYPITEYSKSWNVVLLFYSDALNRIYETIKLQRT